MHERNRRSEMSTQDILKLNDDELIYWLSKFAVEIRKKKHCGEVYPPSDIIIIIN